MKPSLLLPQFDAYLVKRGLNFEGVVIGATALDLLGVTTRETQDCDIIDPEIPPEICEAAKSFAVDFEIGDTELKESWFNNGPSRLVPYLKKDWRLRLVSVFNGKALKLLSLSRVDLLATKLLAYCDRRQDLSDCIALEPNRQELLSALPWVAGYDANPDWPKHVLESFQFLARKLGYEL